MTDSMTTEDDKKIDEDAAIWAARKLSGRFSEDEQRNLETWLEADPRHMIAYQSYIDIAETSALAGAVAGLKTAANDRAPYGDAGRRRRWPLAGLSALAASVFAAAIFVTAINQPPASIERYATLRGETREIALPDGSAVTLDAGAVLTYQGEDAIRRAVLEKGEVFFEIAHNPERPFVIDAGEIQATVVGTSFSIRRAPDLAQVSVVDGIVDVRSAADDKQSDATRLTAGRQVTAIGRGALSEPSSFDPQLLATWRHGYLYFDSTPLEYVVADLNRYFESDVELADPAIGDMPVSGRIELDDQNVAVNAISIALSLAADRTPGGSYVLRLNE